jgi:hypothetical protein
VRVAHAGFYPYRLHLAGTDLVADPTTECPIASETALARPLIITGRNDLTGLRRWAAADPLQPTRVRVANLGIDAPVSAAGTALTALYAAGGPTPNGSLRRVQIRRGGKLVETLDAYDYLVRGDASHDPRLESGDVIFVPIRGPSVRVVGEINRPGTYELRQGESLADVVGPGEARARGALARPARSTRARYCRTQIAR